MSPLVIVLVLCAALLHASWNAILRSRADRLWSITLMGVVSVVIVTPFLFVLAPPAAASWPCIALSSVLQIAYCFFLVRAYREGELAQVYPIARGTAPLMVTLGAAVVAGERLSLMALVGVIFVSLGIMALAFEKARPTLHATLAALTAGAFTAGYTLTDGVGARLSDHVLAYTAWLYLVQGLGMVAAYVAVRRQIRVPLREPETWKVLGAGIFGLLSYGAVIWALSIAPMGQVSALRETGILFAALIGVVLLKEKVTLPRAGAAVMIATGAVVLSAGG
jgi:drug/metabolite transporter (DMT)-like permease